MTKEEYIGTIELNNIKVDMSGVIIIRKRGDVNV